MNGGERQKAWKKHAHLSMLDTESSPLMLDPNPQFLTSHSFARLPPRSIANWTEVDWCILAGLLLNVFTKGSVGVFETLGVGVAVNTFGFKPAEAGYVTAVRRTPS